MTRERLQVLSIASLREIAGRSGIQVDEKSNKDMLIEQILEAMEEDKTDRENSNNNAMRIKEKKFEILKDEEIESQEKSEYSLPTTYDETKIVLLLRDPLWAFTYWDLEKSDFDSITKTETKNRLLLRVYECIPGTQETKGEVFDIPVKKIDRSWYINLPRTGSSYYIEFINEMNGSEIKLCSSNTIHSPRMTQGAEFSANKDVTLQEILAVSGLLDIDDSSSAIGIPQRIISFLDTQYLHLQG